MRRKNKRGEKIFIERETSEYEAGSVTIINVNALVGGREERVGGYWRDNYRIQTDVVLYLSSVPFVRIFPNKRVESLLHLCNLLLIMIVSCVN